MSSLMSPCVVTVVVPFSGVSAWVRLVGDVEMGAEAALQVAVDRIEAVGPRTVVIDLAGVTFAGSELANFLAQITDAAPGASVSVCRAIPAVELVLVATGFNDLLCL